MLKVGCYSDMIRFLVDQQLCVCLITQATARIIYVKHTTILKHRYMQIEGIDSQIWHKYSSIDKEYYLCREGLDP